MNATMLPVEMAEPIMRHFAGVPGVKPHSPLWADKADARNLIVELSFEGRRPGLYFDNITVRFDIVRQARIEELIANGLTFNEARKAVKDVCDEDGSDWRSRVAASIGMTERVRYVEQWIAPVVALQRRFAEVAKETIGTPLVKTPEITKEYHDLCILHLNMDERIIQAFKKYEQDVNPFVRRHTYLALKHRDAVQKGLSTGLRLDNEDGSYRVGLDIIGNHPFFLVEETVSSGENEADIITFDGKTLRIYNPTGPALGKDSIGIALSQGLKTGDEDIDSREILAINTRNDEGGEAEIEYILRTKRTPLS